MPADDDDSGRVHIGEMSPGTVALLRDVAEEASEKTCRRWFEAMGLDPNNKIESQAMFSVLRDLPATIRDPDYKADRDWLRRTRKLSEGAFGKAILTAVGVGVVGALHTLWKGLQAFWPTPPPGSH